VTSAPDVIDAPGQTFILAATSLYANSH